ncbi:uncharacterized protein COLE_05949 [Cutaneotrichosporon oleaginosum]|uniref:uncharacterized protein n=1 Tax=Cutaneotrichosporon oleaginosum TaxID=879819 RepID=UPI001327212E|nr:hypothetical protein COLE_05949 [Cutaneotrichosporon oleaginosum]
MPKAPKGKGKDKSRQTSPEVVEFTPYARIHAVPRPNKSHSQSEPVHRKYHHPHHLQPAAPPRGEGVSANSARRRRLKKRLRKGESGVSAVTIEDADDSDVYEVKAEPNGTTSSLRLTNRIKPDSDAPDTGRCGLSTSDMNGTHAPEQHLKRDLEVAHLRKKVSTMAKADEETQKGIAQMRARIAELEHTLEMQLADMGKTKDEIEVKEKLINDHSSRNDSLCELLHCGVCMEPLDDPYTLQCGHTACLKCLQGWFRSPTAYPAADIEAIDEEDDLTYRTKTCHMCRTPIFRRPIRNILLNHVLELTGLAASAVNAKSTSRAELDLMWSKIFPPEPSSWILHDDIDNVNRCPNCGFEVTYAECDRCGSTFSAPGSAREPVEVFEVPDRVDLGNGLLLDPQIAAMNAFRAPRRQRDRHFLVDDEAEDDEDEEEGTVEEDEEDYNAHLLRTLDAVDYGGWGSTSSLSYAGDSDGERSVIADDHSNGPRSGGAYDDNNDDDWNQGRSPLRYHYDSDGERHVFTYIHDSDSESESERDYGRGRGNRNDGEDAVGRGPFRLQSINLHPAEARRRRHPTPDESDMSDGYESSFIDDGDDDENEDEDMLEDEHDASNGDRSEVDHLAVDSRAESEEEADEPSIEELRRRRAERYA